jgi:p38 MAP kinase
VAIKKIVRPFDDRLLANLAYRELCLLKFVDHDNLVKLLDVFTTATSPENIENLFVFLKES